MSLPAVSGNTIYAADFFGICQPSGGTETGKYFLAGPVYGNGAIISQYIRTSSQGATPVSVSVDTTDQAPTGGVSGSPSTGHLTSSGFQVYNTTTTGPNTNAREGGTYVVQY